MFDRAARLGVIQSTKDSRLQSFDDTGQRVLCIRRLQLGDVNGHTLPWIRRLHLTGGDRQTDDKTDDGGERCDDVCRGSDLARVVD